jgi:hypothetical protein
MMGNLSSLTKISRAETELHCIYIQNKAEIKKEAVLADVFLLSIRTIYKLTVILLEIHHEFLVLG